MRCRSPSCWWRKACRRRPRAARVTAPRAGDGVQVIGTLRTAVVAALLLAAGNAWARGLGQIQVKSKRNQPLLAEIPIVSTTPGELAALQARLASPETFRRVGLAPP